MSYKLIDILKEILTERSYYPDTEGPIRSNVKIAIKNAIENRWILNIYYEGDQENKPGYRWIEPYVWGNNKYTGTEVLRAWQYKMYDGKVSTTVPSSKYSEDNPDGWRMFRLDRIKGTAPLTTRHFDEPREKYHADDKMMSGVKMAVDFKSSPKNDPTGNKKTKKTVDRLKTTKNTKKTKPEDPNDKANPSSQAGLT